MYILTHLEKKKSDSVSLSIKPKTNCENPSKSWTRFRISWGSTWTMRAKKTWLTPNPWKESWTPKCPLNPSTRSEKSVHTALKISKMIRWVLPYKIKNSTSSKKRKFEKLKWKSKFWVMKRSLKQSGKKVLNYWYINKQ